MDAKESFLHYTMNELLIRNFLRPKPYKLKELTRFSSHKYVSIRVALNVLRRAGHVSNRSVIPSALTQPFIDAGPLPDLPEISENAAIGEGLIRHKAFDSIKAKRKEQMRQAVSTAIGEHVQPVLTERKLLEILDTYIRAGAGGKDLLLAIKTRMELGSMGAHTGPPPPTTDEEYVNRLIMLLASAPEHCASAAITRYQARDFGDMALSLAPESVPAVSTDDEEEPDGDIEPHDAPDEGPEDSPTPEIAANAGPAD